MSRRITVWLRRIGITIASLFLLVIAASAVVLGTESGTRWALGHALELVPGEMDATDIHGTFLHGLRIARLEYVYGSAQLTADNLFLRLDWFRSSLDRIFLKRLSAERITYRSLAEPDPSPKPLGIAMPALPVRIGAATLRIGSLHIGDRAFTAIAGQDVGLRGNRIRARGLEFATSGIEVTASRVDTTLAGEVPIGGHFTWRHSDKPWSGSGQVGGSLANLEFSHELEGAYAAASDGRAVLLHRIDPEVDATVRFEEWRFGPVTVTAGRIHIAGTAKAYTADVEAGISDDKARSAQLAAEVSGDLNSLTSVALTAHGPAGRIAATGTLAWRPGFSTALDIQAWGLDPSQLAAVAPGSLDAELRILARSVEEFSLQVASIEGTYDGAPARAKGHLSRNEDNWQCSDCDLSLGPNRIRFDGELKSEALAARVEINAPELPLLWPPLRGALIADLGLAGSLTTPVVSGTASGTLVAWQDWAVSSLALASRGSTREKVDLDIRIDGLRRGDTEFGSGSARLSGETRALDTDLEWSLNDARADLQATIAVADAGFHADIRAASLSEPFTGTWQLAGPLRLSLVPDALSMTAHSWENGDARLDLPRFHVAGGTLDIEAGLTGMPLASVNAVLPANLRLAGYVDATLRLTRQDGLNDGHLTWNQRDTVLRITPPRDADMEIPIPVASADFQLVGNAATGQAVVEIEPGIRGSLELATDGLSADSALRARFRLSGSEWAWIPAFFPEIDDFHGTITTDFSISGNLGAPELQGELGWTDGRLAIPVLNVPLTAIQVTVTGSSSGSASIAGSANAGGGTLAVDGRFDDLLGNARSFTIRLGGDKATVLDWPDYKLIATPDLVVRGGAAGILVNGKVSVDKAEISVRELPEGAVSPSADVAVTGRSEETPTAIPVGGEVELLLGDNVHIQAFGLDTRLRGNLRFVVQDGREPRAEGELELVEGVFASYGQRLTIEEGTLTFTGPLNDPIVFVRAVREIEEASGTVRVGLELRGRALNISSSVFASPAMSEADALSYLVLGYPLQDATVADGSMLSGTAYALGLRQATVITNQLGQSFGLDQLAVAGSNQSTTSLVAGKQINSRLYVRYAYGVFTEIGNLLLRYRLSKRLTIEAGTGESESMNLLYLVEKP